MSQKEVKSSSNPLKVIFCSSEVAPFEKTGGLADVCGTLPVALGQLGVDVRIYMPKYRSVTIRSKKIADRVEICFIEHEEFFNRSGVYGNERGDYSDNLERFSFFCHEVLNQAKADGFKPDVIHAHDWQTALIPVLLKTKYAQDAFYKNTRSVLTIHNLAYQGHFPVQAFGVLGLDPSLMSVDGFEFYGKGNLLKAGILFSDKLTTVSPTYAKEIQTQEFGFGLEGVILRKKKSLVGILNGLDTQLWDPQKDQRIEEHYSSKDLSGKKVCKAALQKDCGLAVDENIPLFVMVTRLAEQKGLEIFLQQSDWFFSKNVQFVLLGEGDPVYHRLFGELAQKYPQKVRCYLDFDAMKAHALYSGADFFLMPSLFEPCGLGQLIAMRYGTLPIVRAVGGLLDTVSDLSKDAKKGNGFVFLEKSGPALSDAITRAIKIFEDKKSLLTVIQRAMRADYSWDVSAKNYLELYKELI